MLKLGPSSPNRAWQRAPGSHRSGQVTGRAGKVKVRAQTNQSREKNMKALAAAAIHVVGSQ